MSNEYDDIINLPHYEPKQHPRMSMWNRAAQFAPFAALTGYDAAIQESARLTDAFTGLDEYNSDWMNRQMTELMPIIDEHPVIEIVYFQPDSHKEGGSYQKITGVLKTIDEAEHLLILSDGKKIPIVNIVNIEKKGITDL